jgi:catechol 2,3-dioxygenase-like lactoylglutathione lyase family enzyme
LFDLRGLTLGVADVARSIEFYGNKLGFAVEIKAPQFAMIRDGGPTGGTIGLLVHDDADALGSKRGYACRFRKLDSGVSMVRPAKNRIRDNISEPLDRARAGCVILQRNMNSHFIIIGAVLPKNSPKVLFAEHDQMIGALAPN